MSLWASHCLPRTSAERLHHFVLRAIVRHEWVAVALFVLLAAVPSLLGRQSLPELVNAAVFFVGVYYLAVRLGLISLTIGLWVSHLLTAHPLTVDLSAWYAGFSVALVAAVFTLALFALHTSRAGQPLLRADLLHT
jgi:hypothetical protein